MSVVSRFRTFILSPTGCLPELFTRRRNEVTAMLRQAGRTDWLGAQVCLRYDKRRNRISSREAWQIGGPGRRVVNHAR